MIGTRSVQEGTTQLIQVAYEDLQNTWNTSSNMLHHFKNAKSEISKRVNSLKIGTRYKLSFEVYEYSSCSVQVRFGDTQFSDTYSSNGIKTTYFTVNTERDQIITFIADGQVKIKNIQTYEQVFNTESISFTDTEKFENKSFTISYSIASGWVGYHSYLPSYYIHTKNNLYMMIDNRIFKHHQEGRYQTFFGVYHPFIVEYVSNQSPIENKTFDQLTLVTKARLWDSTLRQYIDKDNISFSKIMAYNNKQSTGEYSIKIKQANTGADWYSQQTKNNPGEIIMSRNERFWNMDEFRDNVIDYDEPLFKSDWESRKDNYFIDKVYNSSVISFNKSWQELQKLRDKYTIIRLKFDTFNDVNLLLNYSLETETLSIR